MTRTEKRAYLAAIETIQTHASTISKITQKLHNLMDELDQERRMLAIALARHNMAAGEMSKTEEAA